MCIEKAIVQMCANKDVQAEKTDACIACTSAHACIAMGSQEHKADSRIIQSKTIRWTNHTAAMLFIVKSISFVIALRPSDIIEKSKQNQRIFMNRMPP